MTVRLQALLILLCALALPAQTQFPYTKPAGAKLDFTVDWSKWVSPAPTVTSCAWTVPSGLTKHSQAETGSKAIAKISGGQVGMTYTVTSAATTSDSQVLVATIKITVTR